MQLREKKISIIICIKNHYRYLNQALNSIKKQNYKNLEIIICLKNVNNRKFNLDKQFNYKPSISVIKGISNFVKWYREYYNT